MVAGRCFHSLCDVDGRRPGKLLRRHLGRPPYRHLHRFGQGWLAAAINDQSRAGRLPAMVAGRQADRLHVERRTEILSGVGLYTHIFSVPVGGGEVAQVTRESRNYNAFDISGRPAVAKAPAPNPQNAASAPSWKIAYTVNDSFTADDIWAAPLKNVEQAKKITWVNPQIRDFALGKTRVIKWKGPDNLDIEGLLTLPPSYEEGKRYPLILQIHGGPYGRFTD